MRLGYYDPALDYQSGEARASSGEQPGKEERIELPAVLDANTAKSLVQDLMSRRWAKRDKLTVRLPPRFLALEPGAQLELPISPSRWIVGTCTINSFVAVAELWPAGGSAAALVADAGRIVGNPDGAAVEPVLVLMETPAGLSPNQASLMLAASSPVAGWRRSPVELNVGGQISTLRTAARKSKLGRAASDLPVGQAYDIVDSVEIELIDGNQWLTSCDDAALASGANMAIIGKELIQFGDAMPLAPGKFRLGRLLRGRDGTEAAMAGHVAGEWFVLVEADALRMIGLPPWAIGSEVVVTALGLGAGSSEARATIGTEASRPLRGSALLLDGIQVVGERRPAIASPSGGAPMDSEARSAIEAVLTALRQHGLIEM